MKPTFTGTCLAAALGFALTASAQTTPQTPPTASPSPTQTPSASASLDREVKLSGCLKAGTEAGSFELANVKKDKAPAAGASASATPPASAAGQAPAQDAMASAAHAAKNVKLTAASGVDLAAHVNHQIEVAGSWAGAGAAAPAAAAAAPAAGAAASGAMAKTFSVASVKMIAPSCTTGTN